jgi:hypothetical protein
MNFLEIHTDKIYGDCSNWSYRRVKGKSFSEEGKAMEKKLTITVEIDGDRKEIVVRDSAGNSRHLKSVLVTGGGVEEGSLYLFGWGSCADLGWALAEGFRTSGESPRSTDAFYQRVFAHLTLWIAKFQGWALEQPVDPRLILERWEAEEAATSAEKADRNSTN